MTAFRNPPPRNSLAAALMVLIAALPVQAQTPAEEKGQEIYGTRR